jgi:flagellar biosynthetic protein FliS
MQTPYKSYRSNQLDTAAPGVQIAALFDKAAVHIKNAADAITQNDVQSRFDYSQKALNIMEGLLACLNRETPERAAAALSLEAYYRTMIMMIGRVNVFNDLEGCNSLEKSFRDMAEFWRDADVQLACVAQNAGVQCSQESCDVTA